VGPGGKCTLGESGKCTSEWGNSMGRWCVHGRAGSARLHSGLGFCILPHYPSTFLHISVSRLELGRRKNQFQNGQAMNWSFKPRFLGSFKCPDVQHSRHFLSCPQCLRNFYGFSTKLHCGHFRGHRFVLAKQWGFHFLLLLLVFCQSVYPRVPSFRGGGCNRERSSKRFLEDSPFCGKPVPDHPLLQVSETYRIRFRPVGTAGWGFNAISLNLGLLVT